MNHHSDIRRLFCGDEELPTKAAQEFVGRRVRMAENHTGLLPAYNGREGEITEVHPVDTAYYVQFDGTLGVTGVFARDLRLI